MSLCGRGSGREQPGGCAGDSHMMVWVAVGRPPWPRCLVQAGSAHGSGTVLFGSVPLSTLNAQPPELKRGLITRGQGARML